jgi:rRNA-processing protein FCF1
MRILLDECVPNPLKREFADLNIKTVREMRWSGTKNGALLKLMSESEFTILLTSDRNLKYEQNLQQAGIAVIVMVARTNRISDLLPLIPKVREILFTIKPGELVEVGSY